MPVIACHLLSSSCRGLPYLPRLAWVPRAIRSGGHGLGWQGYYWSSILGAFSAGRQLQDSMLAFGIFSITTLRKVSSTNNSFPPSVINIAGEA